MRFYKPLLKELKNILIFEHAHDKTYNKTCATSENSDQHAHLCSLIRVFADSICLLQPPGYPKTDNNIILAILGDALDLNLFSRTRVNKATELYSMELQRLNI